MGFQVQPEILEINEIEGLSTDLQNLNTGATNLLNQTNSLSGSIPESSKNLTVELKIPRIYGVSVYNTFYIQNGIKFTSSNPIGWYLYDIAYGNNKFLIVNQTDRYAGISSDFINWTQVTLPVNNNLWTIAGFGDGKFVVASFRSYVAYSSDGISWTLASLPSISSYPAYYNSIEYGNGKYVLISGYNDITSSRYVAYSSDGITWQSSSLPSSKNWRGLAFGNGKFVTVASNSNSAAYSTDGINWTQSNLPSSSSWGNVAYNGFSFIATAYDGSSAAISSDGINWQNTSYPLFEANNVVFLDYTTNKTFSEILGVN